MHFHNTKKFTVAKNNLNSNSKRLDECPSIYAAFKNDALTWKDVHNVVLRDRSRV